jgi:parallel beta-helix repeat protein
VTIDSNTIKDTEANDWGKASIEIWGTFANGKITHNFIQGSGYAGIEGNAVAGQGHDLSNILIDSNAVYDTMLLVSDGGGIYYMDRSHSGAPVTITNNIVGGFGDTGKWSAGIYLDDQMSNVTVRNNIVYGSGTHAINIHGGDRNKFENNIFHIEGGAIIGLYQADPANGNFGMRDNVLRCNIVYSGSAPPSELWHYYSDPPTPPAVSDNLYWSSAGTFPNSGPIVDSSPVRKNPGFTNAAAHDYSFPADPPMPCFQPVDTRGVGPVPNGG